MTAQYIQLGNGEWNVLVYYNVTVDDYVEVVDALQQIECPPKFIKKAFRTLRYKNTGFTFSNTDYLMSIVCVGAATDVEQFVSTVIHEAKHVQSHICSYYDIDERSETAAYLIGHIIQRMYRFFEKLVKRYV